MLILLDATALLSDPLCTGTAWRVIAHAASTWDLEILVPEVVVAEAIAGYRRRIEEAKAGLQRWGDKHAGPLGLRSAQEAAQAALDEAASSYPGKLREALDDLNAAVVEPPEVAHMVVVERAAARRRPCDADGDGYRDTLNWLTLLGLASDHQDEHIIWVSNNSKDFGSDDEAALHPDLVAELAAIDAQDRVRWIRTLGDLVLELAAEHSLETPADLQAIQARLREETLSRFISTAVLTRAAGAPVKPRDCGLPTATTSAKIIAVGEPSNLKMNVRGAVGDGEAIAEFMLEAETSIQVELPPESSSDDPRFSTMSTDTTGITGQLVKPLRFSGLITLDRYARPQGGEFTRVTARDDDPGLLAWKLLAQRRRMTGLDRPLVPPDILRDWREQMGSLQIGSELARQMREQMGYDFLRHWREQMGSLQIGSELARQMREQMGSLQIGSEFMRQWQEQMALLRQQLGSNLLWGPQQVRTQADRNDEVPVQESGEEKSASEDAGSEGLGEDDDREEPTDG